MGADFTEYRQWLDSHRVDTSQVRVSQRAHTARFLCTTDADNNQIASFYAGAMSEARDIDLAAMLAAAGDVSMVIVCPDDPAAMLRHTRACRVSGLPCAADPSQQIARMPGADLRDLVDGARYLFTNEYERSLLIRKTGWTAEEVLDRVGTWLVTTGPRGAVIESSGHAEIAVKAASPRRQADPTGVGDAFRAGFLAGVSWDLTARTGGPGRLRHGHARAGDGRHPGVRLRPGRPARPPRGGLRRRGRRRGGRLPEACRQRAGHYRYHAGNDENPAQRTRTASRCPPPPLLPHGHAGPRYLRPKMCTTLATLSSPCQPPAFWVSATRACGTCRGPRCPATG